MKYYENIEELILEFDKNRIIFKYFKKITYKEENYYLIETKLLKNEEKSLGSIIHVSIKSKNQIILFGYCSIIIGSKYEFDDFVLKNSPKEKNSSFPYFYVIFGLILFFVLGILIFYLSNF